MAIRSVMADLSTAESTKKSGLTHQHSNGSHTTAPFRPTPTAPYQIQLGKFFVLGTLAVAATVAFGVGYACRVALLPAPSPPATVQIFGGGTATRIDGREANVVRSETLPPPVLSECKSVPKFVYSSKHFETGLSTTSDNMLLRKDDAPVDAATTSTCPQRAASPEDEDHQPAGQHLLVDIKHVDGSFLNSETRLATAMVDLVNLSGLTMLSYHCHRLQPVGVSCVGVLLESHVSFHTWPVEGVITFDLFTCGPKSLLPLLPLVKQLFGVPRNPTPESTTTASLPDSEQPHFLWSYKMRGFRKDDNSNPEETTDMNMFLLGWMEFDLKEEVADVQTDYQNIQIYNVINPRFRSLDSYHRSLKNDGSYESLHPYFFQPEKIVYLDHIMQSRLFGEAAYHEALVHPAMFSHPNPRRAAIIGGGEGATLREVLKHNTIQTVTMVEIDEKMVRTSREYLPEWSDCSNLVGRTASCFDDTRAEVIFADAIAWFVDRFGTNATRTVEKYDVIIMDALDPSMAVAFSDVLYNNQEFAFALANALTDNGVLVSQVGEDDHFDDAGSVYSKKFIEERFLDHLRNQGFQAAKDYYEAHGGFLGVWRYVIAFKSRTSLERWYADPSNIALQMRKRSVKVRPSGNVEVDSPFRYFDGATMMTYQYSGRVNENVYCRSVAGKSPHCGDGHGLNPFVPNIPLSSLEVADSTVPNAGLGLFCKGTLEDGMYVGAEAIAERILVDPRSYRFGKQLYQTTPSRWSEIWQSYLEVYGHPDSFYGSLGYIIESSKLAFVNHGCNNTSNQVPVGESMVATYPYRDTAFDRSNLLFRHGLKLTQRVLDAGEELLENYEMQYRKVDTVMSNVGKLQSLCTRIPPEALNL